MKTTALEISGGSHGHSQTSTEYSFTIIPALMRRRVLAPTDANPAFGRAEQGKLDGYINRFRSIPTPNWGGNQVTQGLNLGPLGWKACPVASWSHHVIYSCVLAVHESRSPRQLTEFGLLVRRWDPSCNSGGERRPSSENLF